MNKPIKVSVAQPAKTEEKKEEEEEKKEEEKKDDMESDIIDSVPATMKSRARQLVRKLKSNQHIVGWNDQGHMMFKGRVIPGTNIIDLVNDSLRQRKNFNPEGWELFSKALGHLNVPEGVVRNENRLGLIREYKIKGLLEETPPTPQKTRSPVSHMREEKRKKRRDINNSPYKWLK